MSELKKFACSIKLHVKLIIDLLLKSARLELEHFEVV
jgi:hypothetical protein